MILRAARPCRAAAGVTLGLVVLCGDFAVCADLARESDSIAWRNDYASALEEARSANRLLWIQFTGPWCPNCTRMERESFPHPAVVERARASFVPLKLQSDVHEQLARDFNLTALPATIIVSPDRAVIATHQGFLGPADFDEFLVECLAHFPGNSPKSGSTTDRSARGAECAKERRPTEGRRAARARRLLHRQPDS